MLDNEKRQLSDRLRRIEGQVIGIRKMIEGDRYCLDVLNQSAAVISAMRTVQDRMLHNHLNTCVLAAMRNVDPDLLQQKMDEIMRLVSRVSRLS